MNYKEHIQDIFGKIEDPRLDRTKKHLLSDIILIAILGTMSGCDSFISLQDFAQAHEDNLRRILELPNGTPSHDTIGRVISAIDVDVFHSCFLSFTELLRDKVMQGIVAIDGKTMRNSKTKGADKGNPLHIVSAWCHENKLCLGQVAVEQKSNEITAIPKLLDLIDIKNQITTIDAMGCQRVISQKIIDKEGDYLLALKANQGSLYEDVEFKLRHTEKFKGLYWEELDKGHGRIEKRQCWSTDDISSLQEHHQWPGLKSIAKITATRTTKKGTSTETRYYISSLAANAEPVCLAARRHWSVENNLHWVLDVTMNEDRCAISNNNAPEIMAICRKFAINILNKYKGDKISLKRAQAKCAMSFKYLLSMFEKFYA